MDKAAFQNMVEQVLEQDGVSDILFTPGRPVLAEKDGELAVADLDPAPESLSAEQVRTIAGLLLDGDKRLTAELAARGSCDLSHDIGPARFRVNVFKQRGALAVVMRRLPEFVPTFRTLGLPKVFQEMAGESTGLVLVAGGTGQGKSNSLAALVDAINAARAEHIITLEDPVEFLHPHAKGTVHQRELGVDFASFADGLRAALRQAPKVILVGEIRDRESMDMVLTAANTGHLVLSTIHATDAGSTISRMLGLFSPAEERLARMRLAECLRWVVCQRLLAKAGGGRVAAFEVLRSTLRSRELILGGESGDKTFRAVMEAGDSRSMWTFDQYLTALYKQGSISEETALTAAGDRARLTRLLDAIKTERGEKTSDLEIRGLEEEDDLV